MKRLGLLLLAACSLSAQRPLDFLNHNRPVLDAHNCYPYQGAWNDRLDRALTAGFPVGIEQDLTWGEDKATGKKAPVISHTTKLTGLEPTLRAHFFERVRPLVEKALAENQQDRWPLIVLHFDFKSEEPELLRAVWDLLGEYESWITTARKMPDPRELAPFEAKPLLVLTEDSDLQEAAFFGSLPAGAKMRLFGSAHTAAIPGKSNEERRLASSRMPPQKLLAERPTNYRRWWNSSWYPVERGGQTRAGDWTPKDDARLRALVRHAHELGFWIRFYTLDGFSPDEDKGWTASYNFGSRRAVEPRWKAAIEAGVNLIATDQYEDLAALLR
ncbi:MAG TPA: hypothetical protein VL285_12655 [Bryobacteraceae bacterium]|nr:hypothetical protein [Bryobacteraceae bacterium]